MNVLKKQMTAKSIAIILWVATPADVLDQAIVFIVMASLVKVRHKNSQVFILGLMDLNVFLSFSMRCIVGGL